LEDFDKVVDVILIEKRFIDEYVKRSISPATKLKRIEEGLDVEEQMLDEESSLFTNVLESLEKEAHNKELELERIREALFDDKEILLIKSLIESGGIERDISISNMQGAIKAKSKTEVRKLIESINAKTSVRYKYPILVMKDKNFVKLNGKAFEKIKEELRTVHPELVALFERYYKENVEEEV
jgi:hypothetical protein